MYQQKITIGLPVYNGEKYLVESIVSILSQSYKNIELIISDNASTDLTPKILQKFKSRCNIKIYTQKKNIGLYGNMCFLIKTVKSGLFLFAADDDLLEKNWVEEVYKKYQSIKKRNALVMSNICLIDENSKIRPYQRITSGIKNYSGKFFLRRLSFFLTPGGTGKANFFYGLFDLEFFDTNWLLKKDLYNYGGDVYFLFDMLKNYEFFALRRIYLFKRIHSQGQGQLITMKKNLINRIFLRYFINLDFIKYYLSRTVDLNEYITYLIFYIPALIKFYNFERKKNFICNDFLKKRLSNII